LNCLIYTGAQEREMDELIVAVDGGEFRRAMSHFASGVTVVTTEHAGTAYGMTVASFASLSLDPPLVVVCIEKNTSAHDMIAEAEKFGVSILSDAQGEISRRFASKVDDRFEGVSIRRGRLELPLIEGALVAIECRLYESLPGGDHTIYVGEVVGTHFGAGEPLIYFRGDYRKLR
jgi:flavin reductase (DIM6/NTAB) family NADH-FMN oxidoreductase RutF